MKTTDRKYTSGLRTPLIIQDLLLKAPIKILALFFFKYRIFFKLITAQYNINNFLGEIFNFKKTTKYSILNPYSLVNKFKI